MLNGLDLFSGIGGMSIALREWVRPVAYCEIDAYCQGVLLSRMETSCIDNAPIWDDIRTLENKDLPEQIDIIYGGFPCQDISIAGLGKGLGGERSGLFYEIVRLAKEIKPRFIFLENVPAITARGGINVCEEVAKMGYDCRWCTISAASIGGLHKRERWFLLAHAPGLRCDKGSGESIQSERESVLDEKFSDISNSISHTSSQISPRLPCREKQAYPESRICGQYASIDEWQEAVSSVCRVTDGISERAHRIRALGNAVVPAQAREAFRILSGLA